MSKALARLALSVTLVAATASGGCNWGKPRTILRDEAAGNEFEVEDAKLRQLQVEASTTPDLATQADLQARIDRAAWDTTRAWQRWRDDSKHREECNTWR